MKLSPADREVFGQPRGHKGPGPVAAKALQREGIIGAKLEVKRAP